MYKCRHLGSGRCRDVKTFMLHPNTLQTNNTMAHGKGITLPYMTNLNPCWSYCRMLPLPHPSIPHSVRSILSYAPTPPPPSLPFPTHSVWCALTNSALIPLGFFIIFIFASPKSVSVPRKQGLGVNFPRAGICQVTAHTSMNL